jgi:ACS family tartrate transporter-like MFS transporter
MSAHAPTVRGIDPLERETIRRVAWRLIPLLMLGYFCAYLDRVNVGFAGLTMIKSLGFSSAVFGFGAGLFFVGYFLAEIPSNLILNKVGARRWIARILITWGLISGLTAFVWSDWSFYTVRILLGLAEAGFYPGVVLFLIWWFPAYYRTRMMALFQSASTISNIIGPPVSAHLMNLDGVLGLLGWQWLFLIEAVPPIIMGVLTWYLLTDRPAQATWLRDDQRNWLTERLESEQTEREAVRKFTLREAFSHSKMWLMTVTYFGQNVSSYGILMFLPLIVRGLGVSQTNVGWVATFPYICGLLAMAFFCIRSDRSGNRVLYCVAANLLCSAGLATACFIGGGHPVLLMMALCCAIMGQSSIAATFWALPSALLTGVAAAGGIAMINSIGNLGGFLGPWMYGLVRDLTGSDSAGLLVLASGPFFGAIALIICGHDRRMERIPPRA